MEALEQVRVCVLATWREAAVRPREVQQEVALQMGNSLVTILYERPLPAPEGPLLQMGRLQMMLMLMLPLLLLWRTSRKWPRQFLKVTIGSGYSLKSFCARGGRRAT